MKTTAAVLLTVLLIACGTHLSAVSLRDEQAGQAIAVGGLKAHPNESDPDNLRYTELYCKSRNVLIQGGSNSASDAGVVCK
jgi:hypothetical protein